MAQSSEDCEQDTQLDRGFPDETEYNLIADILPSEMQILMIIEHVDSCPLPAEMVQAWDKKHLIDFSNQYAGEQPYDVEKLALTKICYTYGENVGLSLVVGRLMSAATWDDIHIIVGCTIIP